MDKKYWISMGIGALIAIAGLVTAIVGIILLLCHKVKKQKEEGNFFKKAILFFLGFVCKLVVRRLPFGKLILAGK